MARTPSSLSSRPHLAWPLALGTVAVLAAGCGSGGSSTSAGGTSAGTSAGTSRGSGPVLVTSTSLGKVLTDRSGRTLYLLTSDTATSTTCTGPCLAAWPPVAAAGGTPTAGGVTGSIGTFTRQDGSKQLTVGGHPLYTYAGDGSAGQTSGEGIKSFGGTWWVVAPDGSPVQGGSSSPSSSDGSSDSGFGY
ncbi:MAG: COG4315 family predicted lipoprotein [Motilibacteraceae bacterium]